MRIFPLTWRTALCTVLRLANGDGLCQDDCIVAMNSALLRTVVQPERAAPNSTLSGPTGLQ